MNTFSVLIVDDSEVDRYILKRELSETKLDIKIFEEPDGEDALSFFKNYNEMKKKYPNEYPPLVIFLDINMPKVDGFSFLEEYAKLRDSLDLKSSVVMMFSSSESQEDRNKALSYGFVVDYLTKGKFAGNQLVEKLNTALKLRNQSAT